MPALVQADPCEVCGRDKQGRPCRNCRRYAFRRSRRRSRILPCRQPRPEERCGRTIPTQSRRRTVGLNKMRCGNSPGRPDRCPWRGSIRRAQRVGARPAFQESLPFPWCPSTFPIPRQGYRWAYRPACVCFRSGAALFRPAILPACLPPAYSRPSRFHFPVTRTQRRGGLYPASQELPHGR